MSTNYRYDVFLSYRRQEPDKSFARDLLKRLEEDGYRVAIDERDFLSNRPFLEEMERCIRESRFTLVVVSPRLLESGNTQKEIRIRTVLDLSERTYCLIPLVIEKVELPTWLYELVSIDFTDPDPFIDPYRKLKNTLDCSEEAPTALMEATIRGHGNPVLSSPNGSFSTPARISALPSRLDLLLILRQAHSADLEQLIVVMGAENYIAHSIDSATKVAGLVEWADRRGRLPDLYEFIRRLSPHLLPTAVR